MTILYIDTNILLNAALEEKNLTGKDLATPASRLFLEALTCKYTLLISSWTIKEMMRKIPIEHIRSTMAILNPKIRQCPYDQQDEASARARSKDNFPDALHIIIAEKKGGLHNHSRSA
ncbi:MAG: type II toxin-antitoxin system VapC family toxin [Nanoarchaeota archaeon]